MEKLTAMQQVATIVNYYDRCRIDCKIDYSKTLES